MLVLVLRSAHARWPSPSCFEMHRSAPKPWKDLALARAAMQA
jgi:hypothetical protein